MTGNPVYIVTDGEYDGPIPGRHSMLAFAAVAVTPDGQKRGEFEAVLERLEGSSPDPETTAFWQTVPEAYKAATQNPEPPALIMNRFVEWIRGLNADAIFVSHPLALDGCWIDFYLQRFTDEFLLEGPWKPNRLFKGVPICLISLVAGRVNRPPLDYGNYPPEWRGYVEHTHRAIDDARGHANLLIYLESLRLNRN